MVLPGRPRRWRVWRYRTLFGVRAVQFGLLLTIPACVAFGRFLFVYTFTAGGHGSTPLAIGLSLVPMSLEFLAGSVTSGRLAPRFGIGALTAGAALNALGFGWLALVVSRERALEVPVRPRHAGRRLAGRHADWQPGRLPAGGHAGPRLRD